MRYDVALAACKSYEDAEVSAALETVVTAAGGLDWVTPGMRVALKLNLVSAMKPEEAATVHPAVVCALVRMLQARGAHVVLGDSPGGLYNAAHLQRVYDVTGLRAAEALGAELNGDFSVCSVSYPEAVQARSFTETAYLRNADAIIDVCKLKTHGMMGMTNAVKNFFGIIPGAMKPEYHYKYPKIEDFANMIVDLCEYCRPRLCICDAVVGMEGNGPTQGSARPIGCLIAAQSAHKLDLAACGLIGLTPGEVPTLTAAIRRELLRGGQVFYVHNRVQDISSVAAKIHELVPESHVGIAHGKMGEKQLDGVIRDFWHRDIDVLVCTTIIETGLDISNANTLIVDHADRFGLSQLHQLRGRVGRGRERAYAYFLYDPTKPMTQQSHDRLATIAQNTALGSGFDVAMKDLELRGTGNLLGDEQSGHIEGVGFDLYVRMVSEAVEQYKEPERKESVAVTIDLPIEASIPVDYIDSDKLRLEAYQKLASARTEDDLDELRDELTDRYGKPPVDFEALFDVARLRFKARKLGISEIIAQGRNVRVSKFEPRESAQMRMARIYKGIQYRPLTKTYLVPAPFAGSLGSKPMSSDEVVGWTSQLLDDLDWKPTPRQ